MRFSFFGPFACAAFFILGCSGRERAVTIPKATLVSADFVSTIDAQGARITANDHAWGFSLHLASMHRGAAARGVEAVRVDDRGARIEIARGAVTEWFAKAARGVEQGFDVAERSPGDGELVLEVAVDGRTPILAADGRSIELRDAHGAPSLHYGELSVKDANGAEIPARFAIEEGAIAIRIDDARARYPIVIDPLVWGVQQAKLTASDVGVSDSFGLAVAVSGTNAIVGAYNQSFGQGAAYVYAQSGTTWTQIAKLLPDVGAGSSDFGIAVAIDGTTALVGASSSRITGIGSGAGVVFTQSGASWIEQATLSPNDGANNDELGSAVALKGNLAVLGAEGKNGSLGAAYVFTRSGTTWTQAAELIPSDANHFGQVVATDGVAIAATSVTTGAAYVFVGSGTSWTQQAELKPTESAILYGESIAIAGDTLAVGAGRSGYVYVYTRTGTTWTQAARLEATNPNDVGFGGSVALENGTLAVGAPGDSGSDVPGAVYVFTGSGASWKGVRMAASDGTNGDFLGASIGLSGGVAVAGTGKESAYVFATAHADGDACASGVSCLSGNCVDGVCCASASCAGACSTCNGATPGTCGPKADKSTPTSACGVYLCDGTSTSCPTSCKNTGECTSGNDCDATKHCVATSPNGTTCSTNETCTSGHCADGVCCDVAQCPSGSACNITGHLGSCLETNATTCKTDGDCGTGHCVDDVCCDQACAGQCEACDVAGHTGTCTPVVGDPHGARSACDSLAATNCAKSKCDGVTTNGCKGFVNDATTPCGTPTCDGDKALEGATCTGEGTCGNPTPTSCVPFTCKSGACLTVCSATSDCAQGFTCDVAAGKCVQGATCSPDKGSSIDKDGTPTSCAPYLCGSDGNCLKACATTDDCASGNACSSGQCVATGSSGGGGTGSGGGCAIGDGSTAPSTIAVIGALAIAASMVRRRRR